VGSATVKTNLGEGQYIVELTKSQAAITAQKTSLTTRKTEIEAAIAAKEIELAALNVTMNEKYEALKTAVGDYAVADPPTKALRKAVTDAQKAYITAQSNCNKKQTEINLLGLELASVNKRLAEIETALTVESRTVWCADYSTALTGSVGTIEINGEAGQINIVPEGKSGIGLLQHPLAMTPSGVFYNWALLPAWQKWKPTYRVGIITAVDKADGKVDVGIPDQYSEGLMINQGGESWDYSYTEEAVTAWEDFATRNPNFALVTNESDSEISNTSQLQKDLDTVNKRVNGSCWQVKDEFEYGRDDYWTIMEDGACGDCEDFALTKAKHLLDLGYPASALHIEIGYTGNGTGHAWLVVQTDKGEYILDNLYQNVMTSGSVPYNGRRRQTGMDWKGSGVKLTDVTVDYMMCDRDAFSVGDEVIVQFTGQSWGSPKVIGFSDNPKQCPFTDIGFYDDATGHNTLSRISVVDEEDAYSYQVLNTFDPTPGWPAASGISWLSKVRYYAFLTSRANETNPSLYDFVIYWLDETGAEIHAQPVLLKMSGATYQARIVGVNEGSGAIYVGIINSSDNRLLAYDGVSVFTWTNLSNPFASPYATDPFFIRLSDGTMLWFHWYDYSIGETPYVYSHFKYVSSSGIVTTIDLPSSGSGSSGGDVIVVTFMKEVNGKLIYGAERRRGSYTYYYDGQGHVVGSNAQSLRDSELRLCNDKMNPLSYTVLAVGEKATISVGPPNVKFFEYAELFYDADYFKVGNDTYYIAMKGQSQEHASGSATPHFSTKLLVFNGTTKLDEVTIDSGATDYPRHSRLCRLGRPA
jgi:predicted transglutaminase-like cysteine proteinase